MLLAIPLSNILFSSIFEVALMFENRKVKCFITTRGFREIPNLCTCSTHLRIFIEFNFCVLICFCYAKCDFIVLFLIFNFYCALLLSITNWYRTTFSRFLVIFAVYYLITSYLKMNILCESSTLVTYCCYVWLFLFTISTRFWKYNRWALLCLPDFDKGLIRCNFSICFNYYHNNIDVGKGPINGSA